MIDYIALNRQLLDLLVKLKTGQIAVVEYGVPGEPGGYWSRVRVRYMPTAGGVQFCVKTLDSRGLESSGFYYHEGADATVAAMGFVRDYHTAQIGLKGRGLRKFGNQDAEHPKMEWFVFQEGTERRLPFPDTDEFLAGIKTITLTLGDNNGVVPEDSAAEADAAD